MGRPVDDADLLVTAPAIAERLSLPNYQQVHRWRSKDKTFPDPLVRLEGGTMIWYWPDIEDWLRAKTRGGNPKRSIDDAEQLVTGPTIATRLGLRRHQDVHYWRAHDDTFPEPFSVGGLLLWYWPAVEAWANTSTRLGSRPGRSKPSRRAGPSNEDTRLVAADPRAAGPAPSAAGLTARFGAQPTK